MKILHKITGAVLFETPSDTLSGADLSGANLRGADLSSANLSSADLSSANLRGADLSGANLRGANLRSANLYGANLSSADLSSANLRGADLSGANLSGETLKQNPIAMTGLYWWILITDGYLTIGCQRHTHAEWAAFGDADIVKMDRQALRFWRQWREPLLSMCAAHAAKVEG